MYNGGGYGSPGPQSILNSSLAGEDPDVIDRFRQALNHLLWSEEDAADRIDAVMARPDSEYVASGGRS